MTPAGRLRTLLALLGGCGAGDGNFSQHPGFGEYYAAHPPARSAPGDADRALLERHRPRFFLPPGHGGDARDFAAAQAEAMADGFATGPDP